MQTWDPQALVGYTVASSQRAVWTCQGRGHVTTIQAKSYSWDVPQRNSHTGKQGDSSKPAYPGRELEATEECAGILCSSREELAGVTQSITERSQSTAQSKTKRDESRRDWQQNNYSRTFLKHIKQYYVIRISVVWRNNKWKVVFEGPARNP